MNAELGLRSIVRSKKPGYRHRTAHKVCANLFQQDFTADKPNQKWYMDFTYLFLKNREVRYNCTILDLYDRSVVSGVTDRNITSGLAIRTFPKALDAYHAKDVLLLHSGQGSQHTRLSLTSALRWA